VLSSDDLREDQGTERIYCSSKDVVLSDTDVVRPDMLFVSTAQDGLATPGDHGLKVSCTLL